MSFGSSMGSIEKGFKKTVAAAEKWAQDREKRLKAPGFQLELKKTRDKFTSHVSEMGDQALETLDYGILQAIPMAFQSIFDDKVKFKHAMAAFCKGLFHGGKTVSQGLRAAVQGTKYSYKWIFAK